MRLKKKGIVAEIAYGWLSHEVSARTNICPLFWRFVLCLLFCVLAIVVVPLFFVIGFFIGGRPSVLKGDDPAKFLTPYRRWPKIRGYRIWPVLVIGVPLAFWCSPVFSACILTAIGILSVLIWFWKKLGNWEPVIFVKDFLVSLKKRVCLDVEFVD